ncbi:hypothetical protein CR513_19504, partial [Mucuna pruriens]
MIAIEVEESSPCIASTQCDGNEEEMRANLDLLQEEIEMAYIHEYATKARVAKRYKSMIQVHGIPSPFIERLGRGVDPVESIPGTESTSGLESASDLMSTCGCHLGTKSAFGVGILTIDDRFGMESPSSGWDVFSVPLPNTYCGSYSQNNFNAPLIPS